MVRSSTPSEMPMQLRQTNSRSSRTAVAARGEVYNLDNDMSECNDLADQQPEMLRSLIDLWWSEAERHGALPLDDRGIELFGVRHRPNSPHPENRRYVYRPPMSPMPGQASAVVGGRNFDFTARVTRTAGDEGVLYATGTVNSGLSFFVQNERLFAHLVRVTRSGRVARATAPRAIRWYASSNANPLQRVTPHPGGSDDGSGLSRRPSSPFGATQRYACSTMSVISFQSVARSSKRTPIQPRPPT